MSSVPTICSDTASEPLLRKDQGLRTRLRTKWLGLDRVSRTVFLAFGLMIGLALSLRIAIEVLHPFDNWPGPRITLPPDHDTLKDDESRRRSVRSAMKHAWDGYRQYAFGHDELKPVSNGFNDKWGGWGVTLVDALDTLYIMDLYEEFKEGVAHVVDVDFGKAQSGYTTPFFEMIIRSLAGLLTAYEMSNDRRLLKKAQQVGDALFPAFNTTTGIPYPRVDVNRGTAVSSSHVCLAEAGTVQLEYWKLSELTGNDKYHQAAQRVVDILDKADKPYPGLYPIWIEISSGKMTSGQITFGGQGDSWYEYMLKQYLYGRQKHEQYKRMYIESIDAMKEKMIRTSIYESNMVYLGDLDSTATKFNPKLQHLTMCCSVTRATRVYRQTRTRTTLKLRTCQQQVGSRNAMGFTLATIRSYILRPETVESLMVLYRTTGDAKYKEWGWQIFQSIEAFTKTGTAYSAYKDVMSANASSQWSDSMESFFLAETLKYLYLLFSPVDYYSLDEYVFNTEAHPFKIHRSGSF
ncbi:glycoside hydrolase [Linderina pennispora]|uniref:alpha-1,2-Mannosidase n=1 Tax=Linderina pennispora TaxID=61395 RepID=A0A1Y1WCF1_9FUNG|nr:glycoside hydrolase [Linderina pennispora]ORX71112.1 glycoside hydrolase [Linderina pennispora]